MTENQTERRECQRIYFERDDKFVCILQNPNRPEKLIRATIKDLSERGMGCTIDKGEIDSIGTGEIFVMLENCGYDSLEFMRDIRLKIKWAVKLEWLDHGGFGCEFLDISPFVTSRLKNFMNAHLPAEASTE